MILLLKRLRIYLRVKNVSALVEVIYYNSLQFYINIWNGNSSFIMDALIMIIMLIIMLIMDYYIDALKPIV